MNINFKTDNLIIGTMKISFKVKNNESPFLEDSKENPKPTAVIGGSEDYYGAFSLEKFATANSLSYTHEDAQGWLDYVTKFKPANFWYKDGNVGIWPFYETYDNWQDTYGADAVNAVYYSGHGGMDGNGIFFIPVGYNWNNQGTTAFSNQMRLGNEQVNYIFWSTCVSCRVKDGQSPYRTWSPANLGFRMLFGFETTSVDSPNYGKYFWEEWNKNKSFSTAWLDESWRISHNQEPSVVACGSTKDEAINRLFNERLFYWAHVPSSWWWWRWYNKATSIASRAPNLKLPKELAVADLKPVELTEDSMLKIYERYGLGDTFPSEIPVTRGSFSVKQNDTVLAIGNDGSNEIQFKSPNISNIDQIQADKCKSIADSALNKHSLKQGVDLVFDKTRYSSYSGTNKEKQDEIIGPYVAETMVQYKQMINGTPVITPDSGEVRVSIDNDGTVTRIQDSTREISQILDKPKNTTPHPEGDTLTPKMDTKKFIGPEVTETYGYEKLLAEKLHQEINKNNERNVPLGYRDVPGSMEIGYDIKGNEAYLVAMKEVEVDFGLGYKKRYLVIVPILE